MSTFYAQYPASAAGSNPSIGVNGAPIPGDATLVGGENPSGNLEPLQTDASGNLLVSLAAEPGAPLHVIVDSSALPTGAATSANQTNASQKTQIVDGSGNVIASTSNALNVQVANFPGTQPISGTVTANQGTPGVGAWPTLAAQSGTWSTTVTQATGTNLHAVIDSGSISVSNFPATQPISGTVTVTQATASALNATVVGLGTAGAPSGGVVSIQGVASGTPVPISGSITATNSANGNTGSAVPAAATQVGGTDGTNLRALSVNTSGQLNVNNISGTVSLPTLAATSTIQTNGTQTTQINNGATTVAVKAASTAAVAADPALVVAISPNNTVTVNEVTSSTATLSNVASSASSVTLLASNTNRKNATIFNDSTAVLYVKFGTTASNSSYTVQMPAGSYYELPVGKIYTGEIDGIWASANGNARVTELT
jgi:hypothetical protein